MGAQMEPYPELSDSFWKGYSQKFGAPGYENAAKKLAEPAEEAVYYHKLADHQEDD
jgi:hypothetical protein